MKDPLFLQKKSTPADEKDAYIADDLIDTMKHHGIRCVGMAANMIGFTKKIIAVHDTFGYIALFNPVILKKEEPYRTMEGCLCVPAITPVVRYKTITVRFQTRNMETMTQTFTAMTAQIIQHEMDHLNGILI